MFENASRLKLRFTTSKGQVSTEDLWDMPLTSLAPQTSLDDLAKMLYAKTKDGARKSFVTKKAAGATILDLQFDIVKHVIACKLEEAKDREKIVANKVQKDRILRVITDKEDENLREESIPALKKMAKKL